REHQGRRRPLRRGDVRIGVGGAWSQSEDRGYPETIGSSPGVTVVPGAIRRPDMLDDDDISTGDGGADGPAEPGPEGAADGGAGTGDGGADGGAEPGPEGPADSGAGTGDGGADGGAEPGP